jgi:hypothetical protein
MHSAPYGNHTDPICGWLDVNARGGHLQGGIVFPDVLAKKYGGRGEVCTRGKLRSEQVLQWLRKRNGEKGLIVTRYAFSTAKVCVSPGSLIRPNHSLALLALSCHTPYVKHRNIGLIKFWKRDVGCCVQILLTPRLSVSFAVAVPLLLACWYVSWAQASACCSWLRCRSCYRSWSVSQAWTSACCSISGI